MFEIEKYLSADLYYRVRNYNQGMEGVVNKLLRFHINELMFISKQWHEVLRVYPHCSCNLLQPVTVLSVLACHAVQVSGGTIDVH